MPEGRYFVVVWDGGVPVGQYWERAAPGAWAIFTGPEGGFDPTEREALRAHPQVVPVTLGERILRADTAALAALAIWQALVGERL